MKERGGEERGYGDGGGNEWEAGDGTTRKRKKNENGGRRPSVGGGVLTR